MGVVNGDSEERAWSRDGRRTTARTFSCRTQHLLVGISGIWLSCNDDRPGSNQLDKYRSTACAQTLESGRQSHRNRACRGPDSWSGWCFRRRWGWLHPLHFSPASLLLSGNRRGHHRGFSRNSKSGQGVGAIPVPVAVSTAPICSLFGSAGWNTCRILRGTCVAAHRSVRADAGVDRHGHRVARRRQSMLRSRHCRGCTPDGTTLPRQIMESQVASWNKTLRHGTGVNVRNGCPAYQRIQSLEHRAPE